jgi:hypothetical protein
MVQLLIKIFHAHVTIIAAAAATAATVDQLHSVLFGVAITNYAAMFFLFSQKRRLNDGRRRAYRRGHRPGR